MATKHLSSGLTDSSLPVPKSDGRSQFVLGRVCDETLTNEYSFLNLPQFAAFVSLSQPVLINLPGNMWPNVEQVFKLN